MICKTDQIAVLPLNENLVVTQLFDRSVYNSIGFLCDCALFCLGSTDGAQWGRGATEERSNRTHRFGGCRGLRRQESRVSLWRS